MKPILAILVLILAAAVADAKANSRLASNASTKSGKGSYSVSTTSKSGKRSSSYSMSTSSKSGKRSKCTSSSKTGKDGSYSMSYPPVVGGGGGGKRAKKIKKLLSNVSGATAIDTAGSCQEYAFKWVAFEDPISPPLQPGADNVRIIQRYVLTVLYCSTNGDNWRMNTNWLTCANECDWQGVRSCNDDNTVTGLDFGFYFLKGIIPKELAALSSLENLSLDVNALFGTVPKELGSLIHLKELDLNLNALTGFIPDEVCSLRTSANPAGALVTLRADCKNCPPDNTDGSDKCCTSCY